MTTVRVKKDERYFSASNEPFNDTRLSWESRGLMGYLLSKPNDWRIRMHDLEKQGPAGNYKLRRMLAELRKYGYMNRIRITKEDNTFDWITDVYESPTQNPNPSKEVLKSSGGKSTSGAPTSGSSTSGKPHDITSTELTSTELTSTEREEERNPLFSFYENKIGALTPIMADAIEKAEKIFSPKWVADAIELASNNGARHWNYCEAVLKRWKQDGRAERPGKKQSVAQSGDYGKYITPEYADLLEH
jgi:DnaD/phage-associated family protein